MNGALNLIIPVLCLFVTGDILATGYLYKNKKGVYSYRKLISKTGIKYVEPIGDIKFSGPLENHPDVKSVIRAAAKKYRVDTALIEAVIKAESNFKSSAISPAGAEGIMQIMPGTAIKFGVINPFNYRESIFGGTRYLRYLLNTFMGNIQLAVAAYNAGETAVFKYGTIPPFEETQQYVKKVVSFYNVYLYRKFKELDKRAALRRDLEKADKSSSLRIAKGSTGKRSIYKKSVSSKRKKKELKNTGRLTYDEKSFTYQPANVSAIAP